MKNFNVDSIHDEKMDKVSQLVNSDIMIVYGHQSCLDESELKGYIKALDWVMENWE